MSKKLLSRLLSFTMSATVALTSGVPALAYDGGGGEDLLEVEDEELLEIEDEIELEDAGADFDAPEEIAEDEFYATEDEAEFESTADTIVKFVYNDYAKAYDPLSVDEETEILEFTVGSGTDAVTYYPDNSISWDSTQDLAIQIRPDVGYKFKNVTKIIGSYTYKKTGEDAQNVVMDNSHYNLTLDSANQVANLILPASFMSQVKALDTDTGTKPTVTITIGAGTTEAETFYAKVDHSTINISAQDAQLKLTYGSGANSTISLANKDFSYFPITDVLVYLGEVKAANKKTQAANDGLIDADKPYFFDKTAKTVELLDTFVDGAFVAGEDITLVAVSNAFTVAQDSANKSAYGSELKFEQNSTAITDGRSVDYTHNLVIAPNALTGNTGRELLKANCTFTYADGTTATKTYAAAANAATVPAADLVNGSNPVRALVVEGVYTELIQYVANSAFTFVADDDATAADGDVKTAILSGADKAFRYETKKAAKFAIVPTDNKKVTSIQYTVGSSTTKKTLAVTESGEYTIPAEDMTNIISLYIATESVANTIRVNAAGVSPAAITTDFVIRKYGTSQVVDGTVAAEVGKDFVFVVSEESHNYKVKDVTYLRNGDAYNKDTNPGTAATVVDASKGIYKVPASALTGEETLDLYVTGTPMVKVTVPKNPKAVVYVGSEAKTKDFYIEEGKAFTFSVRGRTGENDGAITVEKVKYKVGSGVGSAEAIVDTATKTTAVKGTYTIGADAVNAAIVINADTTEIAKAGTYSVKFEPDVGNTAVGIWAGEWKAGEKEVNKLYQNRSIAPSEALYIARKDTTVLTPTVKYTYANTSTNKDEKNTLFSIANANADWKVAGALYEQASALEDDARVAVITRTTSTANIVAQQIGTETLKYTFVKDDDYTSDDHNYVTISGTVALEVKPHYEITLSAAPEKEILTVAPTVKAATNSDLKATAAEAVKDAPSSPYRSIITAKVINTVTRDTVSDNISTAADWTVSSTPWYVFEATDGQSATVVAGAAAPAKTFNVTLTDAGLDANDKPVKYTAATPITLEAVEEDKIGVVATVDVIGGAKQLLFVDGTETLDATVLNKANITYKVYKVTHKTKDWSDYENPVSFAKGLEDEELVDVTSQAAFTMDYYKTGDPKKQKEAGLTITGSAGNYVATATDKTTSTVTMDVAVTVNKVEYAAANVEFTVHKSAAKVDIPLHLCGDISPAMKLSSAYLSGKTYSVGYAESAPTDGYLFKVTQGSQFTLPTESDLDTSVYKDTVKMKRLVGWTISCDAGAILGAGALSSQVFMPGSTAVINGNITSVHPVWANRYSVGTVYRKVTDETQDNIIYTNVLADDKVRVNAQTVTEKAPVTEAKATLTTGTTIPVGAEAEIGVPVTAAIPYATGNYANIKNTTPIAATNTFYPDALAGKLVWHAYDYATAITLPGATAAEKEALATASEYVSFSGNKIKGIKSNLADGKRTWIYATYTGEDGNVYTLGAHLEIVVSGELNEYVVDASKLLQITKTDGTKVNTIEAGQSVATSAANGISIKSGLLEIVADERVNSNGNKIVWTYDSTMLKIDDNKDTDFDTPIITALKAGTTTVKVQFIDKYGVKSNEASVPITITEPAVRIVWTDSKGVEVAAPKAEVLTEGTATNLFFRLLDKDGNDIDITAGTSVPTDDATWLVTSDDTKIVGGKGSAAITGTSNNVYPVTGLTAGSQYDLGSANIALKVTTTDGTYTKEIAISNYATVTFDLSEAKMATSTSSYPRTASLPADIADTSPKLLTTITGVGGELNNSGDYVVKIFKDALAGDGSYTVDLTKFSATYTGTDKDKVSFAGFAPTVCTVPEIKDSYKISAINTSDFVLIPLFEDAKLTSIVTSTDSIVFNNLETVTNKKATVEVTIKPAASKAEVTVTSSTSNSGTIDEFFYIIDATEDLLPSLDPDGEPDDPHASGNKIPLAIDSDGKGGFSILPITNKVGDTVLTVSAPGSDAKDTVALKVYGQYNDGTGLRYVGMDGKDAIDTAITYKTGATTTAKLYYDADGYKIGVKGAARDENGNLVLLDGTLKAITTDGLYTNADGNGNDFVVKNGVIQTGLITVKGVQRYADTGTGALVTYAMTKKQGEAGKWTDTKNGGVYVIDETTNAADEDKLFTVASKVWTWNKAADGKSYASASVVFTSTDGRTKELIVTSTETDTTKAKYMKIEKYPEYTEYTAYASFVSKETTISATDTKWLDKDGNEVVPHDHKWEPDWKWTAVEGNAEKKVATLTLTCNVDAENPHTEIFSDTITANKTGLQWNWTASFEFDGKIYTDSTYEMRDKEGEEIPAEDISNGKGIYIVGITAEDEFKYTGSPIKPAFSVYDADRDMILAQGVDYTVSYSNNTKIGTAQIIVKGKGNYAEKSVAATFKIVSPIPEGETPVNLTGVKLAVSNETHIFNGEAQYPATVTVNGTVYTFDGTDYLDTENNSIPYAWAVENNINKGSGTFALVGVNNKSKEKVVKKTFKIKAAELTASNIKVFVNGEEKDATQPWAVKGAAPKVDVYFDAAGDGSFDYWMNPGQDYKLTFKNNKNVGTATVTISGKGNFAKKVDGAASFAVVPFDLETMAVPQAITAADGVKVSAVKFTLTDFDGNVIPTSKYNVVVTDSEGKALDAKAKLAAGSTILVSATAKDTTNLTGTTEAVEKAIGVNLSKAKIKKLNSKFSKEYTGDYIYLDDEEFNKNFEVTVKVGGTTKTLKAGEDFYISGYSKNLKKGTATAYIVGKENDDVVYSGSRKFTFKITAKKLK